MEAFVAAHADAVGRAEGRALSEFRQHLAADAIGPYFRPPRCADELERLMLPDFAEWRRYFTQPEQAKAPASAAQQQQLRQQQALQQQQGHVSQV